MPFRLLVHVFGARSSPSCSNFALQHIAKDAPDHVSKEAKESILKAFYVDDLMKSVDDENTAIELAQELIDVLKQGGFSLTEFVSNSRDVLNSLPNEKLAKGLLNLDLFNDDLPYERALGIVWNTHQDTFGYKIKANEQPCTKRGILSIIFSIYDPLFLVSPAIIRAKKIFQQTCLLKLGWDEPLGETLLAQQWKSWLEELPLLRGYEVPRCYSANLQNIQDIQLHIFCDGSEIAYGAVAYLRFTDIEKKTYCLIVMARVRLTPLNRKSLKTVPRIELNAAKAAVDLQQKIVKELELNINSITFWSDSTTVLSYIQNDSKRFQRFVSNRIAFIRSHSRADQWRHVPGTINPADLLSRGSKSINDFVKCEEWKFGPEFLCKDEIFWPQNTFDSHISDSDIEIKKEVDVFSTQVATENVENPTLQLLQASSDWFKLRCRVAYMLRLKEGLKNKTWKNDRLTTFELQFAEKIIWKYLQQIYFSEIYETLKLGLPLKKKHFLTKLNPFMDEEGLIKVGGRFRNSLFPEEVKHPVILPNGHHAVRLYIESVHKKVGHFGRENIVSQLHQEVYIVGCKKLVDKLLRNCIICRKLHTRPSEQIMGDLPKDRLTGDQPAFTSTGTDFFGPYLVSRGRGKVREKRYGVLFTCMASRAMHIEIAHSLDVDSFINALRRFIARRGPVKILRSDNGTNFVAGNKELKDSLKSWNENQIDDWCKARDINWKFNPPAAPHFGGIWEREVQSIKKVMNAMLQEFSNQVKMTDELLLTLMCEIEDILNNRPLTAVSMDSDNLEALTPNHILRLQSKSMFPIGVFSENNLYLRKRWRQVQYLADVFWARWRREYIPLLRERQKWTLAKRSHQEGDLVLVVDQLLPRNLWCLGRIVGVTKDDLGHVRAARVKVARYKEGQNFKMGISYLDRPISKLILLREAEEL